MKKSLRDFIKFLGHKPQRTELAVMTGVGIIFHILYPFPFTFPDSPSYVLSAAEGIFNVYRPMGYSSYLAFLHNFSGSPTFVFLFSYILNALATLFLLFSVKYLLGLRGWVFWILAAFTILAPRIIFSTNFIMSDGLFNSLTMIFLATALWMVFSCSLWILAAHLLIFAALFKVRYSGMFFLPVSMVAIFFSYFNASWLKRSLALLPVLVFVFLYTSTREEYVRRTGVDTFSGFSGWQMVNNASVLLPDAKRIVPRELPAHLRPMHAFIQMCPDTLFRREYAMTTKYMWDNELPYKQFLLWQCYNTGMDYPSGWVRCGKLYGEYARELIGRYPGRYLTRFMLPSLAGNFSCGQIIEEKIEFRNEPLYESWGITAESYTHRNSFFTDIYPVRKFFNVLFWVGLWLAAVIFLVTISRKVIRTKEWQGGALLLLFVLIYLCSSALASPNTTWRYMMPLFVPSLAFMAYVASALPWKKLRLQK